MNDVASLDDVRNEMEISAFKNESLGMAVLHLSHRALQSSTSLQEVAKHTRCAFISRMSAVCAGDCNLLVVKRNAIWIQVKI